MRKLRLDTATLRVETFPASEDVEEQRGTVHARGETDEGSCPHTGYPCWETHYNWYTCGVSCQYQCFLTGCMPTCIS
jgi:hypothetical protein